MPFSNLLLGFDTATTSLAATSLDLQLLDGPFTCPVSFVIDSRLHLLENALISSTLKKKKRVAKLPGVIFKGKTVSVWGVVLFHYRPLRRVRKMLRLPEQYSLDHFFSLSATCFFFPLIFSHNAFKPASNTSEPARDTTCYKRYQISGQVNFEEEFIWVFLFNSFFLIENRYYFHIPIFWQDLKKNGVRNSWKLLGYLKKIWKLLNCSRGI